MIDGVSGVMLLSQRGLELKGLDIWIFSFFRIACPDTSSLLLFSLFPLLSIEKSLEEDQALNLEPNSFVDD